MNVTFDDEVDVGGSRSSHYQELTCLRLRLGIAENELDAAENDVYDASHENLPVGSDAWIF